ncbi:VOC family protein [Streptomyces sp. 549]|uniref:VOC family protein n=1 Tax=Streptomyces sp. 549 TaxID=3049076 RepID=UPI0024C27B58|nr:VOC family protein [Streptomyces sp. 549]MDK1472982.1 VOC family protein [Streptomyces sp. 549]
MTTRPGSLNEFCWMDLKTRDTAGTAAFFAKTLGWRFAVDEDDWRKAVKISAGGHLIGSVSDLANPVYPPGTPAHVAYYLAVDDVDRRTQAATAKGARLVLPPFDAGDQGRIATLVDPVGAAFSLWQARHFAGWTYPPGTAGAPHRMVLACDQPDRARDFYRELTGTPMACADFVPAPGRDVSAPQWELAVEVADLDRLVSRVDHQGAHHQGQHGLGQGSITDDEGSGRRAARLSSPEGLTFQIRSAET